MACTLLGAVPNPRAQHVHTPPASPAGPATACALRLQLLWPATRASRSQSHLVIDTHTLPRARLRSPGPRAGGPSADPTPVATAAFRSRRELYHLQIASCFGPDRLVAHDLFKTSFRSTPPWPPNNLAHDTTC